MGTNSYRIDIYWYRFSIMSDEKNFDHHTILMVCSNLTLPRGQQS